MNIMVTGGAGFIGSNIVDALIQRGDKVWVIDNLSTGKRENINNLAHFYHGDICDPGVETLFRENKFDYLVHHAAQIDVRHSVANPKEDAKVNIIGLLNLLESCKAYGVKGIVFASSGGVVYGEPDKLPVEETRRKGPLSPYGVSKLSSECYLFYYCKLWGIKYVVLRYGNVYGSRQDPHGEAGVVAIFGEKVLKGDVSTIFGDGDQLRDYVYVKDIVNANLCALTLLDNGFNGLNLSGDIDDYAFNIGTGVGTSVNQLHKHLSSIAGSNIAPVYGSERAGELKRIYLDNKRAQRYLNWYPKYTIEDGLRETMEFLKRRLKTDSTGDQI